MSKPYFQSLARRTPQGLFRHLPRHTRSAASCAGCGRGCSMHVLCVRACHRRRERRRERRRRMHDCELWVSTCGEAGAESAGPTARTSGFIRVRMPRVGRVRMPGAGRVCKSATAGRAGHAASQRRSSRPAARAGYARGLACPLRPARTRTSATARGLRNRGRAQWVVQVRPSAA